VAITGSTRETLAWKKFNGGSGFRTGSIKCCTEVKHTTIEENVSDCQIRNSYSIIFSREGARRFRLECVSRINEMKLESTYRILARVIRAGTEIQENPSVVL